MNLNKRKYPSVIYQSTGKWFTGYMGDYVTQVSTQEWKNNRYPLCTESNDHVTNKLSLKYRSYSRGRSAANIIMEDLDGDTYLMSMSSFHDMMCAFNNSEVYLENDHWFVGDFMQVKQGQNYFIALVRGE